MSWLISKNQNIYSLCSKKMQISLPKELNNFKFDQIYKKIINIYIAAWFV